MPTLTNLTSNGGSAATSFATASVSPTGGRLILVSIHAYISTGSVQPAVPTVTGNGITYELVRSQTVDTSGVDRANVFLFRGLAASPSSGAITIDFGGVTMTRCSWSVEQSDADIDISGANGIGAILQSVGAISGSGATSLSVNYAPGILAGNAGYSIWGHQVQEAKTPRASWTELADVTAVTLSCLETQWINGTDSAGSATWATGSRAGGIAAEIKAAAPITYLNQYALQGGTTALTMVPPAGTAAGDLEIVFVANKNSSVDPTDPGSGWARIGSFEVGTGADGVGTGKIRLTAWWRELTGASTNTAITITAANRSLGGGMVYRKASGSWATPTISFGSDIDDTTTAFLATMAADLGVAVNEYLLSVGSFTAITSLNGRSVTLPGASSSLLTNINSAGGAVGNHIFIWTDQMVVAAGSQSSASAAGATSGVGTTGGALNVRIGLSSGSSLTLGLPSETDSVVSVALAKTLTGGLPAEIGSALSMALGKPLPTGIPTETDSALSWLSNKLLVAGQAAEIDTALPLTSQKSLALGVPGESGTALPMVFASATTLQLGLAAEVDTAPLLVLAKALSLALVTDLETVSPVAFGKSTALPAATEGDAAQSIVVSKQLQFGVAQETGTAQSSGWMKAWLLEQASEVDLAQAWTTGPPAPSRNITLTGAIESNRFAGSIEPGRLSGTIEPNRLKGAVLWPDQ